VKYEATRGISAPPEVVFNTVTDPDRLAGWVPQQLRAKADEHEVSVVAERLRVEWRPAGSDGWTGALQVRDGSAGGAQVEVTVEPTGSPADPPDGDDVPSQLDGALTELDREVVDNLTAG
jgi:hypothetical protein